MSADPGGHRARLKLVGQALAAVGALDLGTLEEILVDFNLAMAVRFSGDQRPGAGPAPGDRAGPATGCRRPVIPAGRLGGQAGARPPPGPTEASPDRAALARQRGPGPVTTADRFVPVGLKVPFRDADISGELYLMSFARTGAGARFFAVWNIRTPALQDIGLIPFDQFTVTDDRGARYSLEFAPSGDSGWTTRDRPAARRRRPTSAGSTSPHPGSKAVRVGLCPAGPGGPQELPVTKTGTSPGEHAARHARGAAAHRGARSAAEPVAAGDHGGPARAAAHGGQARRHRRRARGGGRPVLAQPRSRPGSPRCAPAWTSPGTGSRRRPPASCRSPGSACWPTTSAGNPIRSRCSRAMPP